MEMFPPSIVKNKKSQWLIDQKLIQIPVSTKLVFARKRKSTIVSCQNRDEVEQNKKKYKSACLKNKDFVLFK